MLKAKPKFFDLQYNVLSIIPTRTFAKIKHQCGQNMSKGEDGKPFRKLSDYELIRVQNR